MNTAVMNATTSPDLEQDDWVPGQIDIWYFVFVEVIVFSSYFIAYMFYRGQDPALFLHAQEQLSQNFGVVNTVILLISSWLIARAVQAAREQRLPAAVTQAWMTIACGVLFIASKAIEWSLKIDAGYTLSTNGFFAFYYFLTGIHVLHVLFGFVFLGVVIQRLNSPQLSIRVVESGAIYWHMVDFLWVIIFALLYVMR